MTLVVKYNLLKYADNEEQFQVEFKLRKKRTKKAVVRQLINSNLRAPFRH